MLEKQERLAVVDRATDTRDELWHNWAMSEAQVDNVIRTMYQEQEIGETFSLASFYPKKEGEILS